MLALSCYILNMFFAPTLNQIITFRMNAWQFKGRYGIYYNLSILFLLYLFILLINTHTLFIYFNLYYTYALHMLCICMIHITEANLLI